MFASDQQHWPDRTWDPAWNPLSQAEVGYRYARLMADMQQYRPTPTVDTKRAAALAWLGERWVLHPVNRVRRQPLGMRCG
ncbi:MAG: hypothetical protein ACK5XA_08535 [Tagaea sp.]